MDDINGNDSVVFRIRKISILIRRIVDNSENKKMLDNVTGTHGYVLMYLKKREGEDVFQRDIEKRFSIRRSTATAILQLMEKNGLIERTAVESDGRLKKITPTKKAAELIDVIEKDRLKLEKLITNGFSEEEKKQLISLLEKTIVNLAPETDAEENYQKTEEQNKKGTDIGAKTVKEPSEAGEYND